MNDCDKYIQLISRMIDGDLSGDEQTELIEHLTACEYCTAFMKASAALEASGKTLAEDPPVELSVKIMGEIKRRRPAVFYLRRIAATAAMFLVVIAGVFLLRQNSPVIEENTSLGVYYGTDNGVNAEADLPESGQDLDSAEVDRGVENSLGKPEKSKSSEAPDTAGVYNEEFVAGSNELTASADRNPSTSRQNDFAPMSKKELCDFYGVNVFPSVIPNDMYETTGNYGIYMDNGGTGKVYDSFTYIRYNNSSDTRVITINVAKDWNPTLNLPSEEYGIREKNLVINGTEVTLGYVPEERSYKTEWYHAAFNSGGVGFSITAENLSETEFMDMISSILS